MEKGKCGIGDLQKREHKHISFFGKNPTKQQQRAWRTGLPFSRMELQGDFWSEAPTVGVVRSPGFEPGSSAWEADVLAMLDYDRNV